MEDMSKEKEEELLKMIEETGMYDIDPKSKLFIDPFTRLKCIDVEDYIDKYGANYLTNAIIVDYLKDIKNNINIMENTIKYLRYMDTHKDKMNKIEDIEYSGYCKYQIMNIKIDLGIEKEWSDNREGIWKYLPDSITLDSLFDYSVSSDITLEEMLKFNKNYPNRKEG